MRFRNYCLVVMGDTTGVLIEIEKISEIKPNVLDAKGILIATFSSSVNPKELNNWFKLNKRSFLVFDLDPEVSGFNINKGEIHEGLFGFLKTINIEDKSIELFREINMTSDTRDNKTTVKPSKKVKDVERKITKKEIEKMSKDDKENLWNKIMDNGIENLTEYDKDLLQFLSK